MGDKTTYRILHTLFFCIILASCNDEEAFDCFKTSGEQIELELPSENFEKVEVYDGMDIFLTNGPVEKIRIKGGKNLLPKVQLSFDDGILKIDNRNRCNWTRDYDPIQVYVTGPMIKEISHFGFGNIVSLDTLHSESLTVNAQGCSGNIELTVETNQLVFASNGVSFVRFSGNVKNFYLGHYFNEGIFNGEDLNALNVSVDHKGYSRMRVRVNNTLTGEVSQNGTLEYITDTATVDVEVLGEGKLIRVSSNP